MTPRTECTRCGSEDIEDFVLDQGPDEVLWPWRCIDCDYEWTYVYMFSGVEEDGPEIIVDGGIT